MVSIIIVNYQSAEYTIGCIKSIFTYSKGVNFEIVLVDNSDQRTELSDLLNTYPSIQYIKTHENLGFAGGNNVGIANSKGDFILLINNDTLVNEDSISIPLSILREHKEVGVVTCQLRYPDGRIQHNCQSFPSSRKKWIERLRLHKFMSSEKRSSYMQGFYFDYAKPGNPDWVWGTFFMFRREILGYLPGNRLNQDYFMYLEDMQWCWDIRKLGYEIHYTPESYIIHFGGGSGADMKYWLTKSMQIFNNKTRDNGNKG